jgi:hypothetical protein
MRRSIRTRRCADRTAVLALALATAAASGVVRAGEDEEEQPPAGAAEGEGVDPEARRLTERGLAHFGARRFAEAIADFEASYAITPARGLLYNLAQAHRLNGNCAEALRYYRLFRAIEPAGKLQQRTDERIVEMEACVTKHTSAEAAPPSPSQAVARMITAPVKVDAARADTGPERSSGRAPTRTWRRWAGVGMAGVAAGLAASSGYFGWRAQQATDDVNRIYDRGGPWGPYAMEREASGQHAERVALLSGAGAALSAALAVWLLVTGR